MDFSALVTISVILLLVATSVALVSRWIRVPYVAGLVLAGLAITELLPQPIGLNSSLVLNLFLPILVFESAINTDISRLRSTIKPISILAGPGVVLSSGVTAMILKWGLGLDWISALLVGVILAITDTVSVIAVFKEISVPSRLSTIVEGESLFNDGIAMVLFGLILQIHQTGTLTPLEGLQTLSVVIIGGSLVGLGIGSLSTLLFVKSDEPLSSSLLTIAVALGAFQISQFLGVSGVIAILIAGLIVGTKGLSHRVSPSTRLTLLSFWEAMAFIVNSFIFLLIGLEVDLITFFQTLPAILLAIFAYQMARLLIYPILAMVNRFDRPVPLRWQHVLFLGNIKGSLSMALALSIPTGFPGREQLITLIFGSVLLSLLVQGISLPWLVKQLKLSHRSLDLQQVEESQAQLMTAKAGQDELDSLLKSGVLPKSIYEEMRSQYQVQIAKAEKFLRDFYNNPSTPSKTPLLQQTKLDAIRRRLLLAEKAVLDEARRKQILSEDIVQERLRNIDQHLLKLEDD